MAGFLDVKGRVCNTRNNVTDAAGYAIPPLASNLAQGQIAVHTSDTDPCLFFKTTSEKIVKIPTESVLVKALTDILGNSAADLDTLRELIAQFEGSANDILPMLVALTDRVTAAETTLGNKANSSTVNAHIQNTSNPHGVTASQVGLGNVRNIDQLGKNETAADSNKLGGVPDYRYVRWVNAEVDANTMLYNTTGFTYANNAPNPGSIASLGHGSYQMQFNAHYGDSLLSFRTRNGDKNAWNNWVNMFHSGNCNNPNTNWSCKQLNTNESIFAKGIIECEKTGSHNYTRITNGGIIFMNPDDTVHSYFGVDRDNKKPVWFMEGALNDIWHAGNSNGRGYDWAAATLRANNLLTSYIDGCYFGSAQHGLGEDYRGGLIHSYGGTPIYFNANGIRMIILPTGNVGFGTNNPTDRVHAVGNIRATEKVIAGGNVESNGSGIFAGDIIANKSGAVVFSANDQAAGSATRLNDLQDVKLPANLTAKMIMAYDPAQINSDGTKGGYTFMPAVGVGTGKVVADDIESLPDITLEGSPYAAVSDKRLKDNIRPLVGATNILLNFAAKEYEWSEEGKKLGLTDPRAYGLIAQEAAELKDIVDIVRPLGISDYLGVDYIKIVPILIAGFQEQNKELGTVNRKIDSIRTRTNKSFGMEDANAKKITTLEAEVAELKRLIRN